MMQNSTQNIRILSNPVDHLLKMWKSLTLKSVYVGTQIHQICVLQADSYFQSRLAFLAPDGLDGSACLGHAFPKDMHLENASREAVRLTTFKSRFPLQICSARFLSDLVCGQLGPGQAGSVRLAMHFPNACTWEMHVVNLLDSRLSKTDSYYKSALRAFVRNRVLLPWLWQAWLAWLALAMHFPNACIWEVHVVILLESRVFFCIAKCVPACLACGIVK